MFDVLSRLQNTMNSLTWFVVIACTIRCTLSHHNLDYSDLEALGVTCSPRDDCLLQNQTFSGRSCECDESCFEYDDCCINAEQPDSLAPPKIRGLACLADRSRVEQGIYVISLCSTNWTGSATIRAKCERLNDMSDPLVAAPVTDIIHNITYRNRYCSECNYVHPDVLQSWTINVECESLTAGNFSGNFTEDFILENMFFKTTYPHRYKWGVDAWDEERGRNAFHPCLLHFSLPEYLEPYSRFCRHQLRSTCSPTWRRTAVRDRCAAYMALVFHNNVAYRNPHCALCNFVRLNDLLCPATVASRNKPPMSFAMLLDVNTNDGNKVGERNPCPRGEVYDNFFKKCRALVCALPGYKMENGRCVRRR